ncbi:hypothetical protein ABQF34_27755 [Mycolicibacterium boenickei]
MADGLRVNTSGLSSGAAVSDDIATSLGGVEGAADAPSLRLSQAGVVALSNAVARVRARQAQRVNEQATAMSTGSARYDHTDGDAAGDITVTV